MIEKLKELGLNYYEAKVLNVLLEKRLTLRELSKEAKIPFGKVYSVVKSLKSKNLIEETNSRPKLVFVDNASEVIDKLLKEKQNKTKDLFRDIKDIVINLDKSKKRNTKFFEIGITQKDNERIQLRSFTEANEEVLQIINIHHKPKSNRGSKTLWEKEIVKAVKRGVVFKSIYPKEINLPKLLKALVVEYPNGFQVKRFDTDFVRCDIIDRKRVLIKIVQQDIILFGGVFFIDDENLASNLINIFNELWEHADK